MKKFILITIVLFIVLIFVIYNKDSKNVELNKSYVDDNQMIVINHKDNFLNLSLREYIIGVVSCEMPALFQEEALKAGAVAARTFYIHRKNNNNNYVPQNTDQCFIGTDEMRSKWKNEYDEYYNKIIKAVESTENLIITYDNKPINAFYFSMSNGYTENAVNVFKIDEPYLVSVDSVWDENLSKNEKESIFSISEFKNLLNLESALEIVNIEKNNNNRVDTICFENNCFSGIEFRKKLGLRSTDFDVNISENQVYIKTKGYGHGVGMSQYGANEMAKLNHNYEDIIKHYYTGVEISNYHV